MQPGAAHGRLAAIVGALRAELEASGAVGPDEGSGAAHALAKLERAVDLVESVAADSFEDFEERIRDLSLLRRVTTIVVSLFDGGRLADAVLGAVSDELRCPSAAFDLLTPRGDAVERRITRGSWSREDDALADRCTRRALRERRPLRFSGPEATHDWDVAAGAAQRGSVLSCGVGALGRTLAVVHLFHRKPGRFDAAEERALSAVAALVGVALRHLQLTAERAARTRDAAEPWVPWWSVDAGWIALVRRDKLVALDKFAASIAHEINNPMSFVLSNFRRAGEYLDRVSELAGASGQGSAELEPLFREFRALLTETSEGLERIHKVACDLHRVGPRQRESCEPADLNEIAETALGMARSEAKPGVDFELRLAPMPAVPCRRLQLVHALFQVVLNAVEAVGESGCIRISTAKVGTWLRVEVADDGPGVAPECRELIFEPFYSTHLDGRAGLGLAIARDAVAAHGGSIGVSGDDGAVFTLSIPVRDAEEACVG